MKVDARDIRIVTALFYLYFRRNIDGPAIWTDADKLVGKVARADRTSDEPIHFRRHEVIKIVMELEAADLIESDNPYLKNTDMDEAFSDFMKSNFRITNKGMARFMPEDQLYSEYAHTNEKNSGFLYRFIHTWLKPIIIGAIIAVISFLIGLYFSKS